MSARVSREDLVITRVDRHEIVVRSLMWALCGFTASIVALVALWVSGSAVSPVIALVLVGAVTFAGFTRPAQVVRREAAFRRRDMEAALAGYLDLVNVLLAGGAGIETALVAAADAGDGWCFDAFRGALAQARRSRTSFWNLLAELGADTGVRALTEVAHSVQLAGEHGSRIRASLVAKAAALRARQLATVEHSAQQSTEQMGIPMVMLFVGFILLVGYPAFISTIGVM